MYKSVVEKLIKRGLTISIAESITGGLISKMITDVSGSSNVLKESFVVYSNDSKISILGVDAALIDKYGVVSKEVAKDMAIKLKMITGRDICISTTGNAGPTVCDDKPVGRVYVGVNFLDEMNVYSLDIKGDREKVREETASFIFDKIEELL